MRWLDTLLGTAAQPPVPDDRTLRLTPPGATGGDDGREERPDPYLARIDALETHIKALYDHVRELTHEIQQTRQDDARRAAEHATMLDALSRLYKRISARIAREDGGMAPAPDEESVLAMRRRLGR